MENLEVRLQKRMHVSLYALLFLTVLLGISVLLEGCSDTCETKIHYTYFEPQYTSLEELRSSTKIIEPQPIKTIGKIYRLGNYLFLNEPGKGIHIIENSDPAHPIVKSFINIPGNYDLAIQESSLYADSFIDLVVFDISDMQNIYETDRVPNVMSNFNQLSGFYVDPAQGLITDWIQKEGMEVSHSDCSDQQVQPYVYLTDGIAVQDAAAFNSALYKSSAITPGNGSGPGVGGSMARFSITNNYLYILDAGFLQPFDISNAANPVAAEKTYLAWDVETIFPYGETLFLGSSSGMHIYDVSSPATPQKISTYEHIRSCDPVVVDEKYAYVTLRSGSECQGFTNQLEVIDIQDLGSPQLISTYQMTNPHGLGIDNHTLFICDGNAGLKVFDASDINSISSKQLAHYGDINAYDVIPLDNILVMIGEDGLFQYDYSDPKNIHLLSQLPVHED
jgi:hypothetical protein